MGRTSWEAEISNGLSADRYKTAKGGKAVRLSRPILIERFCFSEAAGRSVVFARSFRPGSDPSRSLCAFLTLKLYVDAADAVCQQQLCCPGRSGAGKPCKVAAANSYVGGNVVVRLLSAKRQL